MRAKQRISYLSSALVCTALASVAFAAPQQSREANIARAMQAAPASITAKATIMDSDGKVLRPGSNGWVCLSAMGPGSTHPACNDQVWMRLMDAMQKHAAFQTDRIGISYMLAGDDNVNNADPFDSRQDAGEMWVQEGPHLMIVVPDPKMLEGLSDNPGNGGPYVMFKGTPYAHIMVPLGPRKGTK